MARQLAEEEAAWVRAAREEEERQAEMVRRRQEAAARLTEAPAKGADTTQVRCGGLVGDVWVRCG